MTRKTNDRLFMWAGGKQKMLQHYSPMLTENLRALPYVEPFAGGAALFGHLSLDGPKRAILSDVNSEIIDLYTLVRDDPEYLIAEMTRLETPWSALDVAERKAFYYRRRQEYWDTERGNVATALLYFLMKTGFNGIWQTCKASQGRYGTPVGLANKPNVFDADVIRRWSTKLSRTKVLHSPYQNIEIDQQSFVFCDPPYRASFTSYGTDFDDTAQIALIDWCRSVHEATGSTVWLSNRDADDGFFETHAGDAILHRFPVTYTAGRRKKTDDGYAAKPAIELLLEWRSAS
jgi:DNA adenine methylase